ncbi:unnamed protein product [Prorocentrum cordatum]|uniref:tRNA (guanine(9)-N(1))-methyltransferase n=1 Tax=Prorocentrum cordatum TaxID=2364126 RepID=A0ABN9WPZ7_9DINO|nr:unnamed protein product [Polarella glacialis]
MEAAGQANGAGEPAPKKPNRKAVELADFKARCRQGTTVVLDLEWEEDMTEREVRSLCQQLLFCYGVNRGARRPVRMVLSGLGMGTSTSQRLRKISGFESWPIEVLEGPYIDRFKREELVYLTADAEETIQTFDPEKVYIIGGIVDHNRLKGCTLAKAADQGIASAQLPLSQHIDLGASRRVLTVNHVLQIVVEYQLTGDWRQTFEKCVPGRKHRGTNHGMGISFRRSARMSRVGAGAHWCAPRAWDGGPRTGRGRG